MTRTWLRKFLLPVVLLGIMCLPAGLPAQNFANGFGFVLPGDDTSAGAFLPSFPRSPLASGDFISIDQDGHFSRNGSPIRFMGTNLVADGAFPDPAKSWFVAGRLRKLGFNLIRFHHLDNPWSPGSLLEWGSDTRHLNPATLARLESIIAALKENGIYIDMNLHVGRTFNSLDGVPDADSLPEFSKGVTQFDPLLISLQKEYASQLLTHINPATGLSLRDDPVMAMVEITNENSLYRFWRDGDLVPFSEGGSLTVRHNRMLDGLWIAHLVARYGTTDSLRTVWDRDTTSAAGTNQVRNGTFESSPPSPEWILELHDTALAAMSRDSVNPFSGNFSARLHVQRTTGTDWNIQWKQIGLRIVKDSAYTVRFAGRSDSTRSFTLSVMKDVAPWTTYAWRTFTLTPAWQEFSFSFTALESCLTDTRLSFILGGTRGIFWFDNMELSAASIRGLLPGEALESGTVHRTLYSECPGHTPGRVTDISSFYIGLAQTYFREMTEYLRDSLGVRVPIVGTNWNVGPADLAAQTEEVDFVDNHAYWQHPWFPNEAWSWWDWHIENTPMVNSTNGGTIPSMMAGVGRVGRPLTVSEYGHPFPSRFQTEGPVFMTAYGSFHDVDALMIYEYNQSSGTDWQTDFVNGFFDNHRNTALMALMPSLAYAYRNFMVAKAGQTLQINYAPSDYLRLPAKDAGGWAGPELYPPTLALKHAIRVGTFDSQTVMDFNTFPSPTGSPFVTDTREIAWTAGRILSVASPGFAAMTGILNQAAGDSAGPLTLMSADGFGTLTWVSLTGDSLATSDRTLITISSRLQNTNMIWDGTTTVHDDWGTAPTLNQPLRLTLRLRVNAEMLKILPLDPRGNPAGDSIFIGPTLPGLFDVTLDQTTHPTLWFAIEALGAGDVTIVAVRQGWSLVSLPASGGEARTSQLFPTAISRAYTFSGHYTASDSMIPGKGYWLKFGSDQLIGIRGTPVAIDSLPLEAGWNMIGTPPAAVASASITTAPPGILLTGFFDFDGSYNTADTLLPGKGYWVKTTGPGFLMFSAVSPLTTDPQSGLGQAGSKETIRRTEELNK